LLFIASFTLGFFVKNSFASFYTSLENSSIFSISFFIISEIWTKILFFAIFRTFSEPYFISAKLMESNLAFLERIVETFVAVMGERSQ